jgi:protein-arginine kinase activator protein McsA
MYTALYDRRRQLEQMSHDDEQHLPTEDSVQTNTDDGGGEEASSEGIASRIFRLRREMEQAIKQEDYERAAELRDEINRLEEAAE